jgi:hypothetical protein
MNSPPNTRERMFELLCDRALVGLDAAEEHELRALLAMYRGPDPAILDATAAAIALSQMQVGQAMPPHVAARALANAGLPVPHHPPVGAAPPPRRPEAQVVPLPARRSRGGWVPWLVAAACLAVAVVAWWPRPRPELLQARIEAPPVPTVNVGTVEARQALLREAPDAVTVPWTATPDAAAKAASGDVVWSNAQQKGYMRFQGLQANDPTQAQYQLWIFDEAQDKRFPVDGGVFDVDPATGDVVVAIDPKLKVQKPTLFAVTVERPGGVVVSKRERIVLTATPG